MEKKPIGKQIQKRLKKKKHIKKKTSKKKPIE